MPKLFKLHSLFKDDKALLAGMRQRLLLMPGQEV